MESVKEQVIEQNETKSLFICGHCGKDTRKRNKHKALDVPKKVVVSGYASILCYSCRMEFEDSIADVARRYLYSSS